MNINHHCGLNGAPGVTGGMCASHYVFNNVRFEGADPVFYTETRDSTSYADTDVLVYYGGETYFDKDNAHKTFSALGNGCYDDGDWTKCADSMGIRSVRIYSPDRGTLTVTSSEGAYSVPFRNIPRFMGYNTYTTSTCNAGGSIYGPQDGDDNCGHRVWPGGYSFIVKDGESITVHVPSYYGDSADTFSVEYSEPQMAATSITMTVTGDLSLSGGPCPISSSHSRSYLTQYGPLVPQSGAWWRCKGGWSTTSTIDDFVDQIVARTWTVSGSATVSIKGDESTIHDLIDFTPSTPRPTAPTAAPSISPPSTPSVPSTECGYVPSSCDDDVIWAVTTGTSRHPSYYPDFESVTGVALTAATAEDVVLYWFCSEINPNDRCGGLQIPCGRSCDPTPTTAIPTLRPTNPTPSPTASCGNVPVSCQDDVDWAAMSGTRTKPQWYPEFEAVTGVALDAAGTDDVQLYFYCQNVNPNHDCDGLEPPCGRHCGSSSSIQNVLFELSTSSEGAFVFELSTSAARTLLAALCVVGTVVLAVILCRGRSEKRGYRAVSVFGSDTEPITDVEATRLKGDEV